MSRLPGQPIRLLATRPDTAIDLLVARRQRELGELQRNAGALAATLNAGRQPDELFEILRGRQPVADRFTQLVRGCERELLVFDRPPYAADDAGWEAGVTARLREHVKVRGVYAPESLEHAGALEAARRAVHNGERSRVHPQVPRKLAIADRRMALLPLVLEDMVDSALVIRQCALLDALVALFELFWQQAAPLFPRAGAGAGTLLGPGTAHPARGGRERRGDRPPAGDRSPYGQPPGRRPARPARGPHPVPGGCAGTTSRLALPRLMVLSGRLCKARLRWRPAGRTSRRLSAVAPGSDHASVCREEA